MQNRFLYFLHLLSSLQPRLRYRLFIALTILFVCASSSGQTPTSGSAIVNKSPTDYDIAFYQGRVADDPGTHSNYDRLTLCYIRKARETGDISYYDLAEKTLQTEKIETHPDKSMLLSLEATIHFAKHQFSEAGAAAEEALKINPENDAPYATVGDANLEQGEYEKALAAYMKLSGYEDGDYSHNMLRYDFMTRIAHYKFIEGHPRESIASLRTANEVLGSISLGKETQAWTQFILAEELFLGGDLTGAETATQVSLHHLPTYHRALSEMGKIRAAQGKFPEAIDYYKQAISVIPLPIYVAALGDLYTRQEARSEAQKQYDLVEFIAKLSALNQVVYNRELALFYADHNRKLSEALELARKELKIRHDVYTWDTLAWVSFKNALGPEAIDAIQNATRFDTPDPLIFFHAGMIYDQFGSKKKGRAYLEKALALNPHFHPLYADQARSTLKASAAIETSKSASVKAEIKNGENN